MPSQSSWNLYASNKEAWEQMLIDCSAATESIDLEQFIFVTDDSGQKLIDICVERAAAGVKIRFLWDAAGSFMFFGSNLAKDLKEKGIELLFWKTLVPNYYSTPDYRSWYLRNHRRTLVIDGKIGYTGSICFQENKKNWRDTNVRLEGPVVASMQRAFERMWARVTKRRPLPPPLKSRNSEFRYLTNYPAPGRRFLYSHIIESIRNADKFVYITTPYFTPTHTLLRAITQAARRGVDVRIMLPERTDHYPILDLAAQSYFTKLFEAGARVFLYAGNHGDSDNIIHGKTVVIDGKWATVGSLNFDSVSLLYTYEANIVSTNATFAGELVSHFVHDMSLSTEVSHTEWRKRLFIQKIPEYLVKFIRRFL